MRAFFALLLLSIPACSSPTATGCPPELAESWSTVAWSMSDGTSGSTGCHGPITQYAVRWVPSGALSYYGSEAGSDAEPPIPEEIRVPPARLPSPLCTPPAFWIYNVAFDTGTTGPIAPDRASGGGGLAPNFYLQLQAAPRGMDACSLMAADIPPVLPGGTYEVTRGGTWGEEIEWVVRDVRWMLADGRVFTIDEGVWHYRLPDAPVDMGR